MVVWLAVCVVGWMCMVGVNGWFVFGWLGVWVSRCAWAWVQLQLGMGEVNFLV